MTLSSSMTSTAGSVTLEPTSPASLSTVRTSSTDAFSCLPPQRTIAYTENSLSLCGPAARSAASSSIDANWPACVAHGLDPSVLPPACPTRRPQRISDVRAEACCRLSLLLAALVDFFDAADDRPGGEAGAGSGRRGGRRRRERTAGASRAGRSGCSRGRGRPGGSALEPGGEPGEPVPAVVGAPHGARGAVGEGVEAARAWSVRRRPARLIQSPRRSSAARPRGRRGRRPRRRRWGRGAEVGRQVGDVMSASWPTAETTGRRIATIARATTSSLNAQRSSRLPPPRATITGRPRRRGRPGEPSATSSRRAQPLHLRRDDQDFGRRGPAGRSTWSRSRTAAPGRAGDDHDPLREPRQRLLPRRVEEPLGREPGDRLAEGQFQGADPLGLDAADRAS